MVDDMFDLTKDKIKCVFEFVRNSTDEELDDFDYNNHNIFCMLAIIKEMIEKGLNPSQFGTYVEMKFINAYEYIKNNYEYIKNKSE